MAEPMSSGRIPFTRIASMTYPKDSRLRLEMSWNHQSWGICLQETAELHWVLEEEVVLAGDAASTQEEQEEQEQEEEE